MIREYNNLWAVLSASSKASIRKIYNRSRNHQQGDIWHRGYADALNDLFGIHNLTAPTEKEAKESENLSLSAPQPSDAQRWEAYRLDLAKEIAVAKMNRQGVIDPREVVEDANEIVRLLKDPQDV